MWGYRKVKVLFMLLDHTSVIAESQACQNTWIKDIPSEHDVIFIGNNEMPSKLNSYEVYKPLLSENRASITEKMVKSFEYILTKSWDFLIRCDVDVYCNVKNLLNYLNSIDKSTPTYSGQGIHFPEPKHPCYLSSVNSEPPKNPYYYFTQGGFYILCRNALENAIPNMFYPAPIESEAEDIMVGEAMKKSGIKLNDRPDLFNCGAEGWGWNRRGRGCRKHTTTEHISKISNGYISTHWVTADQIYEIHNHIKESQT